MVSGIPGWLDSPSTGSGSVSGIPGWLDYPSTDSGSVSGIPGWLDYPSTGSGSVAAHFSTRNGCSRPLTVHMGKKLVMIFF